MRHHAWATWEYLMLDTLRADWQANTDPLSRVVVTVYRYGHWAARSPLSPLALWPYRIANLLIVRGLAGCDIGRASRIGAGLRLHHAGRGVAIHGGATLGSHCEIYQGVAVGRRDHSGEPTIGDGVVLGAYAVILGPVSIGNGARVGPNAVVLVDVPAGTLIRSPASQVTPACPPEAAALRRVQRR
jgi:serine O-acetyltransferase